MAKVLLGMSGGVDSSVAAIILQKQGYEVVGATMELFGDSNNLSDSTNDAKKVCRQLNIPHHIVNFKEQFKEKVIDNFICEYKNCRTPNPCIQCNKFLKFELMYQKAKELGCEYIATGHYVKMEYNENFGKNVLKKANNKLKDQSYVVYSIPKYLIDKIIFPLGQFETKDEIRQLAMQSQLEVAQKSDSQDICFIPSGNYKEFLKNNSDIVFKKGNIVNTEGVILGKHNGLYNYTIGQRKGLGISNNVPLFVIGFNKDKNEVIVGEEEKLYRSVVEAKDINLLLYDNIQTQMNVTAKIRYSKQDEPAIIYPVKDNKIKVVFEKPQRAITPGQSIVFYNDDIVIGGGIII